MNKMIADGYFQWILKWRYWVVLLTLLIVGFSGSGARFLEFKADYRVFFSKENPQLKDYDLLQNTYNKNDNVLFILAPKSGKIFTPEMLHVVQGLTEEAWQIPFSSRVDSITNFQYTRGVEDDLIVEDLVEDPLQLSAEQLKRIQAIALGTPELINRLISPLAHVTGVNVIIQVPGINQVKELPLVIDKVHAMVAQLRQQHPDLDIYLSGMTMMNYTFAHTSKSDVKNLIPVMFLIVIVMMAFLLKTVSGTIASIVLILFSIVTTMGLAGWYGLKLTGPSSAAPTMILTMAVADCVHILTTLFHEMRQGKGKAAALLESMKVNLQPIFLTSITTAIGFLSLNFNDAPPFRDLGNLVALGVMLAFVFAVSLFPALLMILPIKVKQQKSQGSDTMGCIANFVIGHQRQLFYPSLIFIVLSTAFVFRNDFNDDFVKYFDKTIPFRQAADFSEANLTGVNFLQISVDSKQSNGINNPAYLAKIELFANWLRSQPEAVHVSVITDVIKRLNKNMHGDDPAWHRLPENKQLAAQYLLLYEMSLPYGLDLNDRINVDKSATRMTLTTPALTSVEMLALNQRIQRWVEQNMPEIELRASGPTLMFAHIGQRTINSMIFGSILALVMISILLMFALKSFTFGLVSMIPNLAPVGVAFGCWGLLVGQVGMALSVVASMTLGIVVDDTVHFLSKYLHARRNKAATPEQAVHYAFASVGRALVITTFVLVCGFIVLAQSSFKVNAEMGLMTAFTIVIALIIDFLFLPIILLKVESIMAAYQQRRIGLEVKNEEIITR